jgi:hypothetical protein
VQGDQASGGPRGASVSQGKPASLERSDEVCLHDRPASWHDYFLCSGRHATRPRSRPRPRRPPPPPRPPPAPHCLPINQRSVNQQRCLHRHSARLHTIVMSAIPNTKQVKSYLAVWPSMQYVGSFMCDNPCNPQMHAVHDRLPGPGKPGQGQAPSSHTAACNRTTCDAVTNGSP